MTDRLAIGANNPPPHEAFALDAEMMLELISNTLAAGPVETEAQEQALDQLLAEVRRARKDADEQRAKEKEPHLKAGQAIDAAYKPVLSRYDAGATAIKDALTPYRSARQRAKDDAARIAREQAEAARVAAQEAFQASDVLEDRFAAEEALERAANLEARAKKIDRAPTGLRTSWIAEIVDRKAALRHYLDHCPHEFVALIQRLADQEARGTRAPVAGIAFREVRKAA